MAILKIRNLVESTLELYLRLTLGCQNLNLFAAKTAVRLARIIAAS